MTNLKGSFTAEKKRASSLRGGKPSPKPSCTQRTRFVHRPAGTSPPWDSAACFELVPRKTPPLRALLPARSYRGGRARLLKASRCGRGRAARSSHARLQQPLRVCFRQRAQPGHPSTACREFHESARPPAVSRPSRRLQRPTLWGPCASISGSTAPSHVAVVHPGGGHARSNRRQPTADQLIGLRIPPLSNAVTLNVRWHRP